MEDVRIPFVLWLEGEASPNVTAMTAPHTSLAMVTPARPPFEYLLSAANGFTPQRVEPMPPLTGLIVPCDIALIHECTQPSGARAL